MIFDQNRKKTITAAGQHSKSDYNLYEGTEVTGDVDTVLQPGAACTVAHLLGRSHRAER